MHVMEGSKGVLRWRYVPRTPPVHLRPFVRAMIGYQETAPATVRRRELPYPGLVLIVELEPALQVECEGELRAHGRGFLAGIGGPPSLTVYRRRQRGVQVDLSPLGARALFGVDGSEIEARVVALEDLDAGDLAERLHDAPGWHERFAILDAFFEARLARSKADLRLARWLLEHVERSGGNRAIAELVRESGYSHGHLGRVATRDLGLTPKRLSQLVRFQRLVERLGGHGATTEPTDAIPTFARLASELGYADQSHLVREVRAWTGVAPSALGALIAPGIDPA